MNGKERSIYIPTKILQGEDTTVLLAWSAERVVLSFRGTASWQNLLADLQFWLTGARLSLSPLPHPVNSECCNTFVMVKPLVESVVAFCALQDTRRSAAAATGCAAPGRTCTPASCAAGTPTG